MEENTVPQSTHARAPELLKLAIHANQAGVVTDDHGDRLTAHELSKQALEHSMNAFGLAEKLATDAEKSGKNQA